MRKFKLPHAISDSVRGRESMLSWCKQIQHTRPVALRFKLRY